MSDPIQDIARQLCIPTPTGDGVLAKIRQTIDLLRDAAAERDALAAELAALKSESFESLYNLAIDERDAARAELAAFKAGAGEPVAYRDTTSGTLFPSLKSVGRYGEIGREIKPLYYAQPPARIVMPERLVYTRYLGGVTPVNRLEVEAATDAYNAALDEVTRLNATAQPAQDISGLVSALELAANRLGRTAIYVDFEMRSEIDEWEQEAREALAKFAQGGGRV